MRLTVKKKNVQSGTWFGYNPGSLKVTFVSNQNDSRGIGIQPADISQPLHSLAEWVAVCHRVHHHKCLHVVLAPLFRWLKKTLCGHLYDSRHLNVFVRYDALNDLDHRLFYTISARILLWLWLGNGRKLRHYKMHIRVECVVFDAGGHLVGWSIRPWYTYYSAIQSHHILTYVFIY